MFNFFKKKNISVITPKKVYLFEKMVETKNVEGMYSFISKLPNPDIILRKTGKGLDALRNLTNHYQVGTCIDSRKSGVTSQLFDLEKGNTPEKHFKFYQEVFKNIDIHALVEDILDAPLFGFSPIEISWQKDGNYIIPVQFNAEPQEWFHFSSEGQFFFKHKDYSPDGLLIEPEASRKFLLPINKPTKKNPYGQCILSRCFWNVAFINGGMEFWVKFTEKYGMPFMIGKYDRSMNKEEKEELLRQLSNMLQDAVGVIPADGSVDILEPGGKGASVDIYEKLITKCENNISKSILGQTLTTDIGSAGSYAAANVHNQVRGDIVNSDKRLCEKTLNKLIKYINDINFSESECPTVTIYQEKDIDQSLAERDNKIYNTGVRFTKEYFKKTYGFDDEDFNIIEESPTDKTNSSEFSEQEELEPSIPFTADTYEKLINPKLKTIIEHFNNSRDAEDCMEKLAEVYPEMKTDELEKTLSKLIFISSLVGRLD